MATNNSTNQAHPNVSAHAVLISEGANPDVGVTLATGQVLVGVTGADPVAQTLSAVAWVDQTTTPVTMVVNTGYISDDGATLVSFTLPATAALGSVFEIIGKGSGGWTLLQSTGQSIKFGSSTTTTSSGSLSSTNANDSLRLVCTTANTVFTVASVIGNLTVV
jgi:hypothetical protein